jgi:hypothetical protein
VKDGFLVCPHCRYKKMQRVPLRTTARWLPVWCPKCKHEVIVDIEQGRSFESRSQ